MEVNKIIVVGMGSERSGKTALMAVIAAKYLSSVFGWTMVEVSNNVNKSIIDFNAERLKRSKENEDALKQLSEAAKRASISIEDLNLSLTDLKKEPISKPIDAHIPVHLRHNNKYLKR